MTFVEPSGQLQEHHNASGHLLAVKTLLSNKYFIIACIAVLISTLYWSIFALNAYNTYHEYSDLGLFAYDMFYHINFASAVQGLQYLVFANHISPDQLLILPIFALFPSALTLLVVQAVVISLTGLAVFLAARQIIGNDKVSLFLCVAFLVNPGTFGILVFDYHAEMLIPLFFLLSFYFYFNRKICAFVISLLLLLGTIEVAPFIALAFAITMAIYAILRETDEARKRDWLKYSAIAIAISILAFIVYWLISGSLASAYASGAYPMLPASLQLLNTLSQQLGGIGTGLVVLNTPYMSFAAYLVFALLVIFVGFGAAGLLDPIFLILFASPWLFELFIVGNSNFVFPWYQYFAYTLGGSAVTAILVLKNIGNKDGHAKNSLSFLPYGRNVAKYVVLSVPLFTVLLFLLWPHFIYSVNIYNFQQAFLFYTNQSAQQQVQQLNSMISSIPGNASVMAPFFTMPHLFARQYFEEIPFSPDGYTVLQPGGNGYASMESDRSKYGLDQVMWFYPQYILSDFNSEISQDAISGSQVQNFENITGATITDSGAIFNGSYAVYDYSGLALLLQKKG